MSEMEFQEKCPNCGMIIIANSKDKLAIERLLHGKKHEVETRQEMEAKAVKFADEVLKSDVRIRYVGIVDYGLHVLVSKMRGEIRSLTSDEADRNYMQTAPNILIDVAEKLIPALGLVESVTIRYEKLFMVFFRLEGFTIVLTFEPTILRPFMSALSESIQTLASRYLK
jgi:ribosomal protein S27AE